MRPTISRRSLAKSLLATGAAVGSTPRAIRLRPISRLRHRPYPHRWSGLVPLSLSAFESSQLGSFKNRGKRAIQSATKVPPERKRQTGGFPRLPLNHCFY